MRKPAVLAMLLSVLLAAAPAAWAGGAYLGGGIGASFVQWTFEDLETEDFELSGSDFAYKIYAGYRFIPFLSLEGGYRSLGKVVDKEEDVEVGAETTGWDAGVMGVLPLGLAHLWVKAGYMWWSTDAGAGGESGSEDGTDFMWGLGGDLTLLGIGLRAEWEKFEIENADHISMFSAGVSIGF